MIHFRIKELIEEIKTKGPKYKPFTQRGISHDIVKRYMNGTKKDMGRRHEEIFCLVLRCTPNDLREWVPDGNEPIDDQHPLFKIKPRKLFKLEDELKKYTPEEIRNMLEEYKKKKEEEEGEKEK